MHLPRPTISDITLLEFGSAVSLRPVRRRPSLESSLAHRPVIQRVRLIMAAMAAMAAAPSFAHHSFNAYDMSKTEKVSGSIKEFRWGAPHSSMVLIYVDKSGMPQTMSVTSGSPLMFSKQGFTPHDFHRGDKVTLTYHPNTSGGVGGALATLTLPDGRTFNDNEAGARTAPGTSAPPAGPAGK